MKGSVADSNDIYTSTNFRRIDRVVNEGLLPPDLLVHSQMVPVKFLPTLGLSEQCTQKHPPEEQTFFADQEALCGHWNEVNCSELAVEGLSHAGGLCS